MHPPQVSDWLRIQRRQFQEAADRTVAALTQGADTIREQSERVRKLEHENDDLKAEVARLLAGIKTGNET